MSTRVASSQPSPMAAAQHTSGIFADMTVDGPEIGTLVLIIDRAKNLPNRKALGKQNPYCAARLGKEAKKTETDRRGGQTPRWDQELRFVVHDSLDYHNLKLSVFSEDKKTDLVGEAWISLDSVLKAGGGKSDMWQTLSCKGKYSGEIRIELTYYDSRPRPEKKVVDDALLRQTSSDKVRRRPLPTGPPSTAPRTPVTPSTIPGPAIAGRARHGPRDLQTPVRANSMPIEVPPQQQQQQPFGYEQHPPMQHMHSNPNLPIPVQAEYEDNYVQRTHSEPYIQPDFLPTLPPSTRQRQQVQESQHVDNHYALPRPLMIQPHAYSDSAVPQQQDFDHNEPSDLYTSAPEPLQDLDYQHNYIQHRARHSDVGQMARHQQNEYHDPYHQLENHVPPPPPMHSRSVSAVPISSSSAPTAPYDHSSSSAARPISRGHQPYLSNMSPLQSIERGRWDDRDASISYQPLPREGSGATFSTSPTQTRQPMYHTPLRHQPANAPEPVHRHSVSTPYAQHNLRQSPHPLSQEVPRARSPLPDLYDRPPPHVQYNHDDPYQTELNRNAITPVVKPRAISPSRQTASDGLHSRATEWKPRNTYSIQNPIRAFESSDGSPLSYSPQQQQQQQHHYHQNHLHQVRPRPSAGPGTVRKSISPHPSPISPAQSGSNVPYGPDSFDVHNPTAATASSATRESNPSGPITGWDGREIDPSDHLPVASWAPEPEVKTPVTKTYGQGRDRDFGPRSAEAPPSARFARDINVHRKGANSTDASPLNTIRARLVKKNQPAGSQHSSPQHGSSPVTPLGEHPNYNSVPDPYAQQDGGHQREYGQYSYGGAPSPYTKPRHSTGYGEQQYGAPDVPPKVPMEQEFGAQQGYGFSGETYGQGYGHGQDALSREIASIDIGAGSGRGRVPAPVAYMPVRSHRDRDSFY